GEGGGEDGGGGGSVGDAAAFSFGASKNLGAYGEAGAVTTNSRSIAEAVRLLRDHGSSREHEHEELGINSRLDELQAAVLRVKLPRLEAWNARRREHAASYRRLLEGAGGGLPVVRGGAAPGVHLF